MKAAETAYISIVRMGDNYIAPSCGKGIVMVKVWLADVAPLLEEHIYHQYYRELPAWRREKADKLRYAKGRAQSVGVWSLWSRVKERYGLLEDTVFNLSHSGSYVLCAFSGKARAKVGCDLEEIVEFRESVARRFFCQSEYEHIMANDEAGRVQMFYRYWVLKESFMKATRQGMALDMRMFEIAFNEKGRPILVRKPKEYPEEYVYMEYEKENVNARIAICTTDDEIDDKLHVMRL